MAVDLDDSLLGSDGTISIENKKAIKEAVDKGVLFTIATGRPLQGCTTIVKELDLDVPFITYNGAVIMKGKSKEVLYHKDILEEDAKKILEMGKKYDPTILAFHNHQLYSNKLNQHTDNYYKVTGMVAKLVENFDEIIKKGATKILLIHKPEIVQEIQREMNENLEANVNYFVSKPHFLEFVHRDVSKGNALDFMSKTFHIPSQEIIAIGDSYNDISMIQYAGLGVAVGNAHQEVKSYADYISNTNDDHAVAQVLKDFVLEG